MWEGVSDERVFARFQWLANSFELFRFGVQILGVDVTTFGEVPNVRWRAMPDRDVFPWIRELLLEFLNIRVQTRKDPFKSNISDRQRVSRVLDPIWNFRNLVMVSLGNGFDGAIGKWHVL